MQNSFLKEKNRILIIRLSSLGDILLTTPLIRSLTKYFPKIQLDMIVRKEYFDTIKNNPYLTEKYIFHRDEEINNKLLFELKQNNYGLIIDLQNNLRSNRICDIIGTEEVKFKKYTFDKFLLVNFKINRMKYLPQIPVRYAGTIPDFKLDNEGLDLFTNEAPNPVLTGYKNIGFCPGSKHFTKRWPEHYFIELGIRLSRDGYRIILFGGISDREICKVIQREIPDSLDLSNQNNILQISADMTKCEAVFCNDSGLMHTASTTKTKVIAFFGSTVKEFGFTPYNCNSLILENNHLSCRPCSHIGRSKCPKKHFNCMKELTPESVYLQIKNFLAK